jgi:hypothetical protein
MPNWMTAVRAATAGGLSPFGNRPLNMITLPGTHDAGCYTNSWFHQMGKTQTQTVANQLLGGVRYFDLRPIYYNGQFWIYHGNAWVGYYGGRLDGGAGIIQDVAAFMGGLGGAHELVILNISHFRNFNAGAHCLLIREIENRLGPHLVPHTQNLTNLFNTTFDAIRTDGAGVVASRVAILYDGALDTGREAYIMANVNQLPAGFFTLSPKYVPAVNPIFLFDQYANSNVLGTMQADQMAKLNNRNIYPYTVQGWGGGAGNWTANTPYAMPPVGIVDTCHLFSWTLTPFPFSPVTVAQNTTNPALEGWFSGNHWPIGAPARGYDPLQDQRINVIYVDDYGSTVHACAAGVGCPRNGWAAPVALSEFINANFIPGGGWPGWAGY